MTKSAKQDKAGTKRMKTSLSLPLELWTAARIRALEVGVDAQDLVAKALAEYLRKGGRR